MFNVIYTLLKIVKLQSYELPIIQYIKANVTYEESARLCFNRFEVSSAPPSTWLRSGI